MALRFATEELLGAGGVERAEAQDIVSALAEGARPEIDRVDSVMNLDVACASPHDSIGTVARMMLNNEIRHVPIVQDGAVVRVISEREVLSALLDEGSPDVE